MVVNLGYDPDELVLTKTQILECMDTVENVWKEGGTRRNAKYLAGIKLFKLAIRSQDEKVIQSIFKLTMKFLDLLQNKNKNTSPTTEQTRICPRQASFVYFCFAFSLCCGFTILY